jgi:hypothetical protein
MNLIIIIKNIISKKLISKIKLGRWKLDYCNKIIDRKIYLANIDNCSYITKHN